jgi:hypothetical protein
LLGEGGRAVVSRFCHCFRQSFTKSKRLSGETCASQTGLGAGMTPGRKGMAMTLSQIAPATLLALQWLIAGWVSWRFFHMRQDQRWRSAGLSFGVAVVFLLNAITAASDLPWETFVTISLVTGGLSLFVCGLWLGIALVTHDQAKPPA